MGAALSGTAGVVCTRRCIGCQVWTLGETSTMISGMFSKLSFATQSVFVLSS